MTTRKSLFVCYIFAVVLCLGILPDANAAPLNQIPSPEVTSHEGMTASGQEIVYDGCYRAYSEQAGYFDFLTDNIFTRACHDMGRDFKRNNCWPRPFVWKDRLATRAPFAVMINKGWQRENTLGDYHFDKDTGKLNESGRRRAHWIVKQQIPERRTVYVHRAIKPEITLARVDSVQRWVASISSKDEMPPVVETDLPAPGRPAEEVDRIRVEYLKSMPAPRLPADTGIDTGYAE